MLWKWLRFPLFLLDAERAHHLTMRLFAFACRLPVTRRLIHRAFTLQDPRLHVRALGLDFPNPVGLAAGFDKDARWPDLLAHLGFGFVEVGTLTAHAQPGNDKPRLFRLKKDHALLNRFGFNNAGAADAAARLADTPPHTLVGINIGKSKVVANENATHDYLASLDQVWTHAKYLVVNVSSPNTPGLRQLQDRDALRGLLAALSDRNHERARAQGTHARPLLVKVAPDLTDEQADDVVDLALELGLAGIVATNTTISRDGLQTPKAKVDALGAGGISGGPLTVRSRAFVKRLATRAKGRLTIIGVGGIMTGEDAVAMLEAGATLVQVYSGFVYGGPGFVKSILRTLQATLHERGLDSVSQLTPRTHD